jgi:sugar phosphate isomerase/epimerase
MTFKLGFAMDYPGQLAKTFLPATQEKMPDLAELTLLRMVEKGRKLGFQHLEIPMDALIMLPMLSTTKSWDQLNQLRKEGMTFSIHLPFIDVRLSSLNETLRRGSVATIKEAFALCESLEVEGYVLHLLTDLEEMFLSPLMSKDLAQNAIEFLMTAARKSLTEILEFISPEKLFIENLEGLPAEVVLNLANEFDTKLCLDIGHAGMRFRDPIDLLHLFAPRLGEVHLHDIIRRSYGYSATIQNDHHALGDGWLNLPSVFQTLQEIHFNGPIVLEVTIEQAQRSLAVLRQLKILEK